MEHVPILIYKEHSNDEASFTEMVETMRSIIPFTEEHCPQVLNVCNRPYPIALNPIYDLGVAGTLSMSNRGNDRCMQKAIDMLLGIFQALDPQSWHTSEDIQLCARMACQLALRTRSMVSGDIPTLMKVCRVVEEPAYRNKLLAHYPEPGDAVAQFWRKLGSEALLPQWADISALFRRIDQLLMNPITRNMIVAEVPSVNFLEAMDTGVMMAIVVPQRQLGDVAPLVELIIRNSIIAAAYRLYGDPSFSSTEPISIDEVRLSSRSGLTIFRRVVRQITLTGTCL